MSRVGKAVGGFFDGLLGGGDDDRGDTGVDPNLARQQAELERQQTAEKEQLKKQMENQRISMLRGRFSSSGSATDTASAPQNTDQAAASLFSRITGRIDA